MLDDGIASLKNQINEVKDVYLRELLQNEFVYSKPDVLFNAIYRLRPQDIYPGLDHVIAVITAIYGYRAVDYVNVTINRISIQKINGYDEPGFVLTPCFSTRLNTTNFYNVPSLFWKLVFSFQIENSITGPDQVTEFLYALSLLALPIDPKALSDQMGASIVTNSKAGIPFINYLATYLRQRDMGLNYKLSPFADARRTLIDRAHKFFGIGSTCISDFNYANVFINSFDQHEAKTKNLYMSESDKTLLDALSRGNSQNVQMFTKRIRYEDALEAAKPNVDIVETPDKPVKKTPKVKPKDTSTDVDDGAFSDDSDTLDTDNKNTPDTEENDDDNIDRTSDAGQDSAAVKIKVFFPLALPTETIDDHLLRIALLRYVDETEQDPAPDITPENLEVLKYWCERWLFIASIDQTKKLLAQLKLTGRVKEI